MISPGTPVRVIGGPYNGYQGTVANTCDTVASLLINFEGRMHEVVTDLRFLQPLADFQAGRPAAELALRGSPPPF